MKIAHIREHHAPAGTPWRLAAALDTHGNRWLDASTTSQSQRSERAHV